jgi:ABC-type uncharacterized transport system permease subunit
MVLFFARWFSLGAGILFCGGATLTLASLLYTDPPKPPHSLLLFTLACLFGGVTIGLIAVAIRSVRR